MTQDNSLTRPIIIIDNDCIQNRVIESFLTGNGYSVIVETTGLRGMSLIKSLNPILVILDIVLPDVDGLSICRDVRSTYQGPILITTALTGDIDEVASLETGADGYLTKPIQPRVLLAHIRALLRRHTPALPVLNVKPSIQQSTLSLPLQDKQKLVVGRIQIFPATRTVLVKNKKIDVTSGEFEILWYLATHSGQILSRDKLYYHIRGIEYDGIDRAVDQHISNIRKKVGDDSKTPTIIKSIRGIGYLLAG